MPFVIKDRQDAHTLVNMARQFRHSSNKAGGVGIHTQGPGEIESGFTHYIVVLAETIPAATRFIERGTEVLKVGEAAAYIYRRVNPELVDQDDDDEHVALQLVPTRNDDGSCIQISLLNPHDEAFVVTQFADCHDRYFFAARD